MCSRTVVRCKHSGASNMSAKEQEKIAITVEEKLQRLFGILKAKKVAEDKIHHCYRTLQGMKDVEDFSYFIQDPWEYFGFHGAPTVKATTNDEGGKKTSEDDELLLQSFQILQDMNEEDFRYFTQNPDQYFRLCSSRRPPK
ncbi:hypothetical protein BHM03_00052183 [Ensete ventricosum]|nr:hypothetical protein BHM03_00052183 [Ensete ventricosum]